MNEEKGTFSYLYTIHINKSANTQVEQVIHYLMKYATLEHNEVYTKTLESTAMDIKHIQINQLIL